MALKTCVFVQVCLSVRKHIAPHSPHAHHDKTHTRAFAPTHHTYTRIGIMGALRRSLSDWLFGAQDDPKNGDDGQTQPESDMGSSASKGATGRY